MTSKELLAPRDMTAAEARALVDEYLANGGVITQCAPGTALNYRGGLTEPTPQMKRPTIIKRKNKNKK